MHLRLIVDTVKRLQGDRVLRQQVARDPDVALAGTRLTRDERLALAALSQQPGAVAVLSSHAW